MPRSSEVAARPIVFRLVMVLPKRKCSNAKCGDVRCGEERQSVEPDSQV